MNSFSGNFKNTVDKKGRIAIPFRFRKILEENQIHITRGLDQCLYIYPAIAWDELEQKLQKLNQFDPKVRKIRSFFAGNAEQVEMDKQGRITLNPNFLNILEINLEKTEDKKLVLVGDIEKIQIWNPGKYESYITNIEPDINDIASEIKFDL